MNEGVGLLLSILAVIAVILVAAAIIAVLGNMIIGAFGGTKKDVKDNSQDYQVQNNYNYHNQTTVNNDYDFETISRAKAEKELAMKQADEEEFNIVDDSDEEIEEIEQNLKTKVEEPEEDDLDDIDSLLDDISDEVVEDEKNKEEEVKALPSTLDNYNIESYLDEEEEETEEVVEEPAEEVAEPETEVVDQSQEVEELKAQLAEAYKQLEEARNVKTETVTVDMTEEACLERLAILEERLKNAKAELKVNMKEYRPIRKVMKDLERYQTKLRRKEAVVANKKIALYGVNKYVDIDKEQAEKVLNESELLDGLRLSVQHCEEVIAANKDRYPILEHTNKILTADIENIEQDIESTKQTLQNIRDKKEGGNDEGENGENGENE